MMGWLRGIWQSRRSSSTGGDAGGKPSEVMTDPKIESMIARAESLMLAGNFSAAAACIEDALVHRPESARAHRIAAMIRLGLNEDDAALDHFTLAAHFAPTDWESAR